MKPALQERFRWSTTTTTAECTDLVAKFNLDEGVRQLRSSIHDRQMPRTQDAYFNLARHGESEEDEVATKS